MKRRQNILRGCSAAFGTLLLWPLLAVAKTPAPLGPVPPEPVPFRVEQQGEARVIHLGTHQYRLLPSAQNDKGILKQPLDGAFTGYASHLKPPQWRQNTLARYAGPEGFERVWLLPGFGLALANRGILRDDQLNWTLLRGNDGVVNPPVPGVREYSLNPYVARPKDAQDALQAERTLLIFGSKSREYWLAGKVQRLDQPVSAAWLFDREGVLQHWSPLANLRGWSGAASRDHPVVNFHHVYQNQNGDTVFASAAQDSSLNLHIFSADSGNVSTLSGVRLLRQQKEDISASPKDYVDFEPLGAFYREKRDFDPLRLGAVLLAPLPGVSGWYGLLQGDGKLTAPDKAIGVMPLVRHYPARRGHDAYDLVYGYVLAYRVANDIRYGWASPELTRFTGPVWRNALVVNSERAAEVNIRLNTAPQLLLAQLDSGEWQAYAEPKLHIPESSFGEPNSFGGLLPPAANPRDAALLAEAVLIAFSEQSAEAAGRAHFGAIDQANRRSNEYRASRAQRESFWLMAIEGVMGGVDKGAREHKVTLPPLAEPSALGPNYYWQNGKLWHRPSGREVK